MQKLPNPDKAVVDIDKLMNYCLNMEHQDGQHKAKVFKSALNLGIDNVQILRDALLDIVCNQSAVLLKPNEYGEKYIIDFEMNHSGKNAKMNYPAASGGVSLRSARTLCGSTPLNSALRTLYFITLRAAGY